ncbi:MAG: hypothetical protein IKU38_00135 [Clostridia bacterium]|nr:hypothetical protein [Clostridia bacterium]
MSAKKKAFVSLAICIALIAIVFASGILDRQKTWEEIAHRNMHFEGGLACRTDAYGVMNEGPGFDLPAGEYRIKWMIEGDADNRLLITTKNGVKAEPSEIAVEAGVMEGEARFSLPAAAQDVEILVSYDGGSYIQVHDMRLYSPVYRDYAWLFALAALSVWLLYALQQKGMLTPARRGRLILIGMAVLMASGPAFKDTVCLGHDSTFHLVRLCNLADGLAHGQFPVRAGGFSYNGYGAITSVFYPDIFLYPFALMMALGASMQFAVNLFFVSVNIGSAASMYIAARRIFKEEWAAVCASILYTLSIYRVTDVFTRYAFGEMTAMAFVPLFMLGLYEAVLGDKRSWRLLGVSAACIYLSHMLSTLICAMTAAGVCVLFAVKIVREGRLAAIVKAACLALALCAFQLVPFIQYSLQGIGAAELMKDPANAVVWPAQLFLLGEGEMSVDPLDYRLSSFALEIGLPLIIAAGLTLYIAATAEKKEEKSSFALLLVAAGSLFALMATSLFPWSHVRVLTRGLSDYLQFPWRFLMMTAVCFALAGGWGLASFARGHGEQMAAAALCVAALCALPTLTDETRNPDYILFGESVSPNLQYTEYTIPGTQTALTLDQKLILEGGVQATAYEKDGTSVTVQVSAGEDGSVTLPLFGYDGYRVELNGQELAWTLGENNRLSIALKAGMQGELRVWFAGRMIWRAAEAVSVAAALVLMSRRKKLHCKG